MSIVLSKRSVWSKNQFTDPIKLQGEWINMSFIAETLTILKEMRYKCDHLNSSLTKIIQMRIEIEYEI